MWSELFPVFANQNDSYVGKSMTETLMVNAAWVSFDVHDHLHHRHRWLCLFVVSRR